jgi:hypothetical protein
MRTEYSVVRTPYDSKYYMPCRQPAQGLFQVDAAIDDLQFNIASYDMRMRLM